MLIRSQIKYIMLMALAVLLSSAAVLRLSPEVAVLSGLALLFGASPMRVVRRVYGRGFFWLGSIAASVLLITGGLVPAAVGVLTYAVLIGVYSEVEESGSTVFHSAWIAILVTVGLATLSGGIWLYLAKINLVAELKAQLAPIVEAVVAKNPHMAVTVETVVQQLPSGFVILLMLALAIALIWESRMSSWFKLPRARMMMSDHLLTYQVPDLTVWLVMVAILGAFLQHGNKALEVTSVNALNIFFMLYFFQGLAVIAHAFRTFKVGLFWQTFWYIMIVMQLFPVVSLLGFSDYWLEFRQRMTRKPAETNKGF